MDGIELVVAKHVSLLKVFAVASHGVSSIFGFKVIEIRW